MADVFISYSSEDRNRVRPLAEALQARGFNIWWDRSLAAGQDFTTIIERELRAAKVVIVVWTQSSTASAFVRDEAGRARDERRLVPVMLDRVEIPLGFGAFQAEDFTQWNGGSNAPQMQVLEEAIKAKLEGREADGGAIASKRRQLMARVRVVSLLSVVALLIGIAVGGKYLFAPPEADLRAQLLQLLAEGTLTPEQAIELAQLLESDSFGGERVAMADDGAPPPSPSSSSTAEESPAGDAQLASVSEAEFDMAARETYRAAFMSLSQHPEAQVRIAVAQMAQPDARDAGIQTMWAYAQSHPDDPLRDEIYLLCGAVGEHNDNPLGQRALVAATSVSTQDPSVWQMLSRSYARTNRGSEAEAAALVSEGVEAQNAGRNDLAEQRMQQALPNLTTPELRAPVVSGLGQIAENRGDYDSASARFAQAYSLREQTVAQQPASAAAGVIEADAQQLVRALDRSGRTEEACERLRQAQEAHDVAAPDQDIFDRCQRLRVELRSRVELSPQLRQRQLQLRQTPSPEQQRAPVQQTAPEQRVAPGQ
jgi:tetratricopeptide (TPR) repeat protein